MYKHIVLFSGGIGSYFATKRLIERGINKEDIILLFTDTKTEDEDLYRFLDDAERVLGIKIHRVADGRNIWQVFKDNRFLSNSRVDHCSRDLKRKVSRKIINKADPKMCTIYLGYDWTEMNRLEKAQKAWEPYKVEAPLCESPYIDKEEMKRLLEIDGIELPKLYKLGFAHNNCGGICVKAGIGHYVHLLEVLPDKFKEAEDKEQEMREYLNRDISILNRTINGVTKPFTLRQLREERETLTRAELCDIGGCGCFQNEVGEE